MTPCGGGLFVSPAVSQKDLRQLLHSLRTERCVHSWRNFDPDSDLEHLQRWENTLRPTTIFFYYYQEEDACPRQPLRLVGAATVADAINHEFPFSGFPVLARCYVFPEFRDRKLYRTTVQHRIEYCHHRLGDDLKAIHIGTASDRVVHTITNVEDDRVRFIRGGAQVINAGDDVYIVDAFVHLTPGFARSIVDSLTWDVPHTSSQALLAALEQMMSGAAGEHAVVLSKLLGEARRAGQLTHHDVSSLEQLLLLFKAIPVVGLDLG